MPKQDTILDRRTLLQGAALGLTSLVLPKNLQADEAEQQGEKLVNLVPPSSRELNSQKLIEPTVLDLVKGARSVVRDYQSDHYKFRLGISKLQPSPHLMKRELELFSSAIQKNSYPEVSGRLARSVVGGVRNILNKEKFGDDRKVLHDADLFLGDLEKRLEEGKGRITTGLVEEPNLNKKPRRSYIRCSADRLLNGLHNDAYPDPLKQDVSRYGLFVNNSLRIINDKLTTAKPVEIEREAVIENGELIAHPVIVYSVSQDFENTLREDDNFTFNMRQSSFIERDESGKIMSFTVVNESTDRAIIEPDAFGDKSVEYGLQFYMTVLKAERDPASDNGIKVSYKSMAVPYFRDYLAKNGFFGFSKRKIVNYLLTSQNEGVSKRKIVTAKDVWSNHHSLRSLR